MAAVIALCAAGAVTVRRASKQESLSGQLWLGFVAFALALFAFDRVHRPILDDGPLHGQRVSQPASGIAQTLAVGHRYIVLNYDPIDSQQAPVVCIVRGSDPLRPAQECTEMLGLQGTTVRDLNLVQASQLGWNTIISGTVSWTYGREAAQLVIGPTGTLREYWYSW